MEQKFFLFVDDERNPPNLSFNPEVSIVIVRNYKQATDFLWHHRDGNVFISLDHDLGEEKTGYDICKFIVENEIPLLGTILHTYESGRQAEYETSPYSLWLCRKLIHGLRSGLNNTDLYIAEQSSLAARQPHIQCYRSEFYMRGGDNIA